MWCGWRKCCMNYYIHKKKRQVKIVRFFSLTGPICWNIYFQPFQCIPFSKLSVTHSELGALGIFEIFVKKIFVPWPGPPDVGAPSPGLSGLQWKSGLGHNTMESETNKLSFCYLFNHRKRKSFDLIMFPFELIRDFRTQIN